MAQQTPGFLSADGSAYGSRSSLGVQLPGPTQQVQQVHRSLTLEVFLGAQLGNT